MRPANGMTLLSIAITPKTADDAGKLARALELLTAADDALRGWTGQLGDRVVIGCVSEQHLETVVDRLARDFHVEAGVGRPEVVYREALTRTADGEMKYFSQTGGRGEYAHVKIRLRPGTPGTGHVFANHTMGGVIPAEFIKGIEEAIQDRLTRGVLAGYPIADVRVELCDGSYHDIDSSETAFRIAGALAVEKAARNANLVLMEPVMRVEAVVPAECWADVTKDLVSRRGQIQSQEDCGQTHVIRALVPLAELFGYATDLHSRTRGRGTCAIEFETYAALQAEDDDDGRVSMVGVPLRPAPKLRDSGIALPEPDHDAET